MSVLEKIPAFTLGLLTWQVSSKAVAAAGFACQASWEQNSWLYLEEARSVCLATDAGLFRAACSNLSLFHFLQGNRR